MKGGKRILGATTVTEETYRTIRKIVHHATPVNVNKSHISYLCAHILDTFTIFKAIN